MTAHVRRPVALAAATTLLLLAAACGGGSTQRAATSPVALSLGAAPQHITIGVVVSLTSDPGEGADWSAAAEGAAVAAYRYRAGGIDVRILPVNDRGSSAGGAAAVRQLVDRKVSGIVMATEGSHLSGALAAAQTAGVPVLLPYETDPDDLPDDAWLTGPDSAAIGAALTSALADESGERPLLIDAGGGTPDGLVATRRISFSPSGDPAALAARVSRLATKGPRIDSVVISGAARTEADVLVGLQGESLDLPTLLTPQALSPVFALALDDAGGSLDDDLTTVGLDGGDTTALDAGAQGATASAYLAALRAAAQDPGLDDYFDSRPFATVAGAADTRSHDAVVALVNAAARAASADPKKVAAKLPDLRVTRSDGLGGPDLHFADHEAVDPAEIVTLRSTSQGTGLRPVSTDAPALYWFDQVGR